MVKIGENWYDVNNIRKITFENEHVKVYFYNDEETLDLLCNQTSFNWLLTEINLAKSKN